MTVRLLRLSAILALPLGFASGYAQEAASTKPDSAATTPATGPAPDGNSVPANSGPTPPTKHAPHAISSELAATLAVGRPKFSPPPPPVEQKAEDELPDMRDLDKPRNGIIRLPKMVVQGSRPPIFTEKKLYTQKAFAALLAKRYYSEGYLAFSRVIGYTPLALIFPTAESSALARYQEEERLKNMSDLSDAATLAAKAGDKADSEYIKAQSTDTYMRRMDWGYQGAKK